MSIYKKIYHSSEEVCLICETKKEQGIHIMHSFICMDCEKELVNTKTSDPKYSFFVYQMGKAVFSQDKRRA
ncbi:sigma factor G inhibitor Gin [Bacillus sp. B1-b2]|uniref:sigma factor G inhibitor Gin n=1 Tax=Bacillus sp. B1-b2 TaxID=2653201 RepID=UPI0012625869|nr:sigma factor G inhibitor Gin [Bacillus sp. B1-b2]KAB7663254.1 carnitine--CoA ligase [Bacillus sp. B1-b2]